MSPKYNNNLVIVPVKKKNWMDHSHRCMPITEWAASSDLNARFLRIILHIHKRVADAGPIVPYIDITGETVLLTWDNDDLKQRRLLYIELNLKASFRYQVAVRHVVGGDHDWKYLTDTSQLDSMLTYLGEYLEGVPVEA